MVELALAVLLADEGSPVSAVTVEELLSEAQVAGAATVIDSAPKIPCRGWEDSRLRSRD